MSGTNQLPTVLGPQGLQPQAPSTLRSQLLASATSLAPGLTATLPGSLIEDLASTSVAAIALCDSFRVDLVNSISPYAANAFILQQQGALLGIPLGLGSTTSLYVVFAGSPGYSIAQGFTVGDGTYQYVVQQPGVVGATGFSLPLFALATSQGSWAVPANTATTLVTSVPTGVTLSVTNPNTGTPGSAPQTESDYRAQVWQALQAPSLGWTTALKTALQQVSGVQARLVSVRTPVSGGFEVICGGSGDPYQIANAIFLAVLDLTTLVGSTLGVAGITNANPGVVTTTLNHGFSTGQVTNIAGVVGVSGVNSTPLTITVLSPTTFSIGINTTSSGAYVSGGVVTPNFRNVAVSIQDYPDTYTIPFVVPPQQVVTLAVTWNSIQANYINAAVVSQLASVALLNYINSIPVGQPINQFEMIATFQQAVTTVLNVSLLTRLVFLVAINGLAVSPLSGTGEYVGDPESYFFITAAQITITQG